MQYLSLKSNKSVLTGKQFVDIQSGRLTKAQVAKHIETKKHEAFCHRKLKSSGLWDARQNKTTLTVRRISDLSTEERREMGMA